MRTILWVALLTSVGCGDDTTPVDASSGVDATGTDASTSDGGEEDASSDDAISADGATDDAAADDAAADDAAADDAAVSDAGSRDAGDDTGALVCMAEMPCRGACTGRSCDSDWVCLTDVGCTDDIVAYCGCDGTTFFGSSTCPSQPYASRGECEAPSGSNCDGRTVRCLAPQPVCERTEVPEVSRDGSCWTGRCVPIGECACDEPAECSDPDRFTCRRDTGRCIPFI